MTSTNPDELRHHIGRLLQLAHRDYAKRAIDGLRELGYDELTPFLAELMSFVDADGRRSTTIAAQMGTTKQATGEGLRQLTTLGFVRREPDPTDNRATLVALTEKGTEFFERVRTIKTRLDRAYSEILGEERFRLLCAMLEEVVLEDPE